MIHWVRRISICILMVLGTKDVMGKERPNLLFLLTDDQAPWATGVTDPLGNAQTPHMDRLMSLGARLTHCYTPTPVCSPSRTVLMTSRYGTEFGITDWIHPRREPDLGVPADVVMWPELLQAAGYRTALIGKWHLGTTDEFHPTQNGFDVFMGHREGGWSPVNPTLEKDGRQKLLKGLTTDLLADEVIRFIEQNQEGDRPFLVCWHTRAPHTSWLPVRPEDQAPYPETFVPRIPNADDPNLDVERVVRFTREYLSSVRGVDRNLGRVMRKLDQLGLTDDTVIVFAADHGYSMGHNGIWHKGNGHWIVKDPPEATPNIPEGQRPNMFDNSIFVPAAIVWPGVIAPGKLVENSISFLDFFPTILAMTGVDLPPNLNVRGRNFLPLLVGDSVPGWDDSIYGEYSTHHQSQTHMRMWRTRDWKLVRDFRDPERDEFYDLKKDPGETNNLIASKDPVVKKTIARFHDRIISRMRTLNDPVVKSLP